LDTGGSAPTTETFLMNDGVIRKYLDVKYSIAIYKLKKKIKYPVEKIVCYNMVPINIQYYNSKKV